MGLGQADTQIPEPFSEAATGMGKSLIKRTEVANISGPDVLQKCRQRSSGNEGVCRQLADPLALASESTSSLACFVDH